MSNRRAPLALLILLPVFIQPCPAVLAVTPPEQPPVALVCKPGFVPREARPGDPVCVKPVVHARTVRENGAAPTRIDPAGAYGPISCQPGFVWREAYPGDAVCVEPQIRDLVREDNRLAPERAQPEGITGDWSAAASGPEIVCERSYTNWAWGYVHAGIYIDVAGTVYRFESHTPPGPDQSRARSNHPPAEPHELIAYLQTSELAELRRLVAVAAQGKVSDPVQRGADQGTTRSQCWQSQANGSEIEEITLLVVGDVNYRNMTPEATELDAWLTRLGEAASLPESAQ